MFTLYIPTDNKTPFAAKWTSKRNRFYWGITPSSLARLLRHADLTTITVHSYAGNVSVDIV